MVSVVFAFYWIFAVRRRALRSGRLSSEFRFEHCNFIGEPIPEIKRINNKINELPIANNLAPISNLMTKHSTVMTRKSTAHLCCALTSRDPHDEDVVYGYALLKLWQSQDLHRPAALCRLQQLCHHFSKIHQHSIRQ